jgi:hypothetical protein
MEYKGAMEALRASEPSPMDKPLGLQESFEWEKKGSSRGVASIEGALIFAAISSRAIRCARMLVAMPDFNEPLFNPRKYRQGVGGVRRALGGQAFVGCHGD